LRAFRSSSLTAIGRARRAERAGKSTLLRIVAGLDRPDEGHVVLGDRERWGTWRSRRRGRHRIAVTADNGAGKTTLLRVVAGELAPTSGRPSPPRRSGSCRWARSRRASARAC
jgi:ABC-type sulfate/molybdate transport systems ATPase subunit